MAAAEAVNVAKAAITGVKTKAAKSDMEKIIIQIINTSDNPLPQYASEGAAGVDLYAAKDCVLRSGEVSLVPTGIFIQLPEGYEAQIRGRSWLALRHGVMLVNGIGTIDSDYRGEIKVIMTTCKAEPYTIRKGERIAQMVISKLIEAQFELTDSLEITLRNQGGFGSSGK